MSCERFRDELGDAAAGAPASARLVQHLQGCDICRARLEGERALLARIDVELRSSLSIEPTPGLLLRARRRAEERSSAPAIAWRWLVPAAVSAFALVLAVSLGRDGGRPPAADRTRLAEVPRLVPSAPPAVGPVEPEIAPPGRPTPAREPGLRTAPAAASRPSRSAEPEVLVTENEAVVFRSFVRSVATRSWDPRSLLAAGLEPEAPPVSDIQVGAVEIAPLAIEALPNTDSPVTRSDS